jgi:hypothetical protein
MILIIWLALCLWCAIAGFRMAEKRNRDAVAWAVICFLFGLFGIIILAVVGPKSDPRATYAIAPFPQQIPVPVTNNPPAVDREKWEKLIEYDVDLAAAVKRIAAHGDMYSQKLAIDYMTIGDKAYLESIVSKIEEISHADKENKKNKKGIADTGIFWGVSWSQLDDGTTLGHFEESEQEFATKREFENAVRTRWRESREKPLDNI